VAFTAAKAGLDGSIRAAIGEAQDWFAHVAGPATLTADTQYPLANRVTSGRKVVSGFTARIG